MANKESAVAMKNGLKQAVKILKGLLEITERQDKEHTKELVAELSKKIPRSFDKLDDEKAQFLFNAIYKKWKKNHKDKAQAIEINYRFSLALRKSIVDFQYIINAYENDRVKHPIASIEYLISSLAYLYLSNYINIEDFSICLGMAIFYNANYEGSIEIGNIEIQKKLADFYHKDGSFQNGKNAALYKSLINELFQNSEAHLLIVTLNLLIKDVEIPEFLNIEYYVDQMHALLNLHERDFINASREIKSDDILPQTTVSIAREDLEELALYYKNYSLVAIPEDIEAFQNLMDRCNLAANEQRVILNLINEKIAELNADKTLLYLNLEDAQVYTKATEILNTLRYSADDYYEYVNAILELKQTVTLLEAYESEEEKEYIEEEIASLMARLRELNSKHVKEEILSDNNIIFLLDDNAVPYSQLDLDKIDKSLLNNIRSLPNKISKEMQPYFRKVITDENIEFSIYAVLSGKIHFCIVEVGDGVFALVGATMQDNFRKIVNRVKMNSEKLNEFKELLKDEVGRNALLREHEQYLNIFSLEERDSGTPRKRKHKNSH